MAKEQESVEGRSGWKSHVRDLGHSLLHQSVTRRRAWIIVASFLVCGYALGVFGYVLATPEIGVRCAFTPIVNHFYPEFLYPPNQDPLQEGDVIVEVGGQAVENWSQLLRKMILLRSEEPKTVEGLSAKDVRAGRVPEKHTFLSLDGRRLVRVVYRRPGEQGTRIAWCRLGRSPLETLVPSVLWFFLKTGLFIVGAIVFWKRPEDRPAAQFFWLCIVSFGAYMGGYHWSRIVTQPVLILVFMTCAVMLPAVTLHFYLVFPRAKGLLLRCCCSATSTLAYSRREGAAFLRQPSPPPARPATCVCWRSCSSRSISISAWRPRGTSSALPAWFTAF
jgi:hypothetical protein